jgi:pimeloyl-ACP methyl ester carboxylesterase
MTDHDEPFRHRQIAVGGSSLHVVELGDPQAPPVLFLHGWPESWQAWRPIMTLAAPHARAIALDMPGIGGSTGDPTDGSTSQLAAVVHQLIASLGLSDVTIVGHDLGGMIAYAYLRRFPGLARAVIMNTVVPGVPPWDEVLRNPYVWHFAMHSIPNLPEQLVEGRQREYFDYFFDVLSPDPAKITLQARQAHVEAYRTTAALTAGFSWYRELPQDAAANQQAAEGPAVDTPVLYLRGENEGGRIADYVAGFRSAALTRIDHAVIPGAGHFSPEEAPDDVWRLIADFAGL